MALASGDSVVIVGAGVAGLTAARALREEGFTGPISLIGDEVHPPYLRPPLSKQVLTGEWTADRAHLLDPVEFDGLGLEWRPGARAHSLDIANHTVAVGGTLLRYDSLIIATGVAARQLDGVPALPGVHTLRTIDDAVALRADLGTARRLVVVGNGVLGSEVASAARKLGLEVVLLGRTAALRLGQLGDRLAVPLEQLHRENGVEVRLKASVAGLVGTGRVEGVTLADRSVVGADVVVVAVGGVPSTGWLAGSGLELSDGVLCNAVGCAAPDVYAVGDVARWRSEAGSALPRAEHNLNAIEQSLAVAHLLARGEPSPAVVPFFWSELHGTRIQVYGRFGGESPLEVVAGDPAERRFVAVTCEGRRVTGAVGWNMPRDFRDARVLVDQSAELTREKVLL